MANNKKQTVKKATSGFITTYHILPQMQLINATFEASKKFSVKGQEDSKIFRRHSIDDNGGGYQGL
jgi:hypothetical protein